MNEIVELSGDLVRIRRMTESDREALIRIRSRSKCSEFISNTFVHYLSSEQLSVENWVRGASRGVHDRAQRLRYILN